MSARGPFAQQPTLTGRSLRLRPLRPDDFDALYAVAADRLLWVQHPEPLRFQRPVFETFFAAALRSGGALLVLDMRTEEVLGSSRYYDVDAAQRELAIGYTFLARSRWGGAANAELKQLMLDHAFGWARRAWFHVGADNMRSRKAMEKIGAVLTHKTLREDSNGVLIDYVVYAIDAQAWRARTDAGSRASPGEGH